MPNRHASYRDMEKFLITRNNQRRRYYQRTAGKYEFRRWTAEEDKLVMSQSMTDTKLSSEIRRSVSAIQNRRCKLKKEKK